MENIAKFQEIYSRDKFDKRRIISPHLRKKKQITHNVSLKLLLILHDIFLLVDIKNIHDKNAR